jgi:DNA-directed RNA polymerase subunit RPC12/RpoP
VISFKCLKCLRSWAETPTFSNVIGPKMRCRCAYCGSREIRKVIPWR